MFGIAGTVGICAGIRLALVFPNRVVCSISLCSYCTKEFNAADMKNLFPLPAVQLHRRQLEVPRDVCVLDLQAFVHGAPLKPLRRYAARRDRRPAPERLELRLGDHPVLVHLQQ